MTVGEKLTVSIVHTLAQENSSAIQEIRNQLQLLTTELAGSRDESNDKFDRIFEAIQSIQPPSTAENVETTIDPGLSSGSKDDPTKRVKEAHEVIKFTPNKFSRTPKVDFPRFDGTNPRGWVQKCERYFAFHNFADSDKVDMAAIHFDSKIDPWFLNYQQGKPEMVWHTFFRDMCLRFEDVAIDNYVGSFNKLSQLTTVDDYYDKFEHYKAYMVVNNPTLPESFYTLSFISGLKDEIRTTVQMFKPRDTSRAFYFARMQQASLLSSSKPIKNPSRPFFPSSVSIPPNPSISKPYFSPTNTFQKPSTSSQPPFITHPPTPTKTDPPLPPIKKLTPQQIKVRRDKGLCYNCDELYRVGHICKTQQLFMLVASEEDLSDQSDTSPDENMTDSPSSSDTTMEISLHALTGQSFHDTIRISGHLHQQAIMVLIDTGSTHSFIDFHLADKLNVHISPTAPMLVTVSNGDSTISKGMCRSLHWEMQGYNFYTDLRALPLGGCDMVLGADWLRQLGDVLFNFSKLTISFMHHGCHTTLQGSSSKPSLSLLSFTSFKKFIKSKAPTLIGQFFHVHATPMQPIPSEVSTLIDSFSGIFSKPTQLTPSRPLDHKIPLKPNSIPPSQRPYKCPFIHKVVVEQLVQEMLSTGLIQKSHNPFAAPILLVKKKDGTWRFCVDYRKLNDLTVKDKFPIPLIEEFLDELNGAVIFTKIDLLSDHVKHLTLVFSLLRQHSLYAKFSKCSFAQPQLEYLGHLITGNGVAADLDKVEVMLNWPQPQNLKQLRGFLGLTGYYRKFIKGYGNICKPLTEMLKKNSFFWKNDVLTTFSSIKSAMTQAPVLALSDFTKTFTLETDAFSRGVGVVLLQDNRPIAFYSRPLGPKALALSTYE
ncbi:uncharacterized protein LOC113312740 [Papaver somniferum]|uniref:uncharacterized protein LOC113312740 n=1 Tax=Papaver somniferum TaxID=3469 RepID=UPI000E6F858F|nr:uncharacterized protein LOC113312740 [Papaver somniferum]